MKLAAVRFSITQRSVCGCRTEEGFTRGRYDSLVERVSKGMDGRLDTDGRTDCCYTFCWGSNWVLNWMMSWSWYQGKRVWLPIVFQVSFLIFCMGGGDSN